MFVLGTRPEAIKLIPVIQAMRPTQITPIVVDTGQHREMVNSILAMADITPDYTLSIAEPGQSLARMTQRIVGELEDVLDDLRGGPERRTKPRLFSGIGAQAGSYPAMVVVQGDTTSAAIGALVAAENRLPVAHVEAGLRTGERWSPFPEEINRSMIGRLASLHLPPTWDAFETLVREGIDTRQLFVSGNTAVDAVMWAAALDAPWPDPRMSVLDDHPGPVLVATTHRRENWGPGIAGIATGLARIAQARPDSIIVLPMHPNPAVRHDLERALTNAANVLLVEPLDYPVFARLLRRADLAISDSGGVQEEAPSLGTPVLVAREVSERMEGVQAGVLRLVGTNADDIAEAAIELLASATDRARMLEAENPFGDGRAGQRIAQLIEHVVFDTPKPEQFGSSFDRYRVLEESGYNSREVAAATEGTRALARLAQQRQDD